MASRYQQRTLYAERGPVKTFEGLDPLTGLPVLIYRFAGRPARALAQLESENLPGVLELGSEGGEALVVVAYSREYRPLVYPLHVSPSVLLLDSARALRDAARAGVRHGDLRPVRFLASFDHVLLEGFGIPWREDADFAEDIRAWAEAVRELAGEALPVGVGALLSHCTDPNPNERPDAAALYDALSEAVHADPGAPDSDRDSERGVVLGLDDLELPLEQSVRRGRAQQEASASAVTLSDVAFGDLNLNDGTPDEAALDAVVLENVALNDVTLDDVTRDGAALNNRARDDRLQGDKTLGDDDLLLDEIVLDDAPKAPTPPDEPEADFLSAWRRGRRGSQGSTEREDAGPSFGDSSFNDPMIIVSDPGLDPGLNPATQPPDETERSYLKTLPPGATYRSGDTENKIYLRPGSFEEYTFDDDAPDRARRRRRVVLLLLLFVAAGILGALALWRQRQTQPSVAGMAGSYVVEVQVTPESPLPATLYVVSSPDGSRLSPGSAISTVPGQVVLDHTGSWRLQARVQGVASEEVAVLIPEQRSVTVEMPTGGP